MAVAGGALAVLVVVYGVDLLVSWGDVPRGVTVAGVEVGGMCRTAAEDQLREELQPRFSEPVRVTAGDAEGELDPDEAGLGVDWQGTLEDAGQQPLSPIERVRSLFTEREVGIVGMSDSDRLTDAVTELAESDLNRKKREGTIKFEEAGDGAVEAKAVKPRQGQEVADLRAAIDTIDTGWLHEDGVELAVEVDPVKATEEGVNATLEEIVEPAVAAPVQVRGEDAEASLQPIEIAEAFTFKAVDDGSLEASVEQEKVKEALQPKLASTEQEAADAEIVFEGGKPTVKPSKDGLKIHWKKSLAPYEDVIAKSDDRVLEMEYSKKKPEVTTKEAEGLGIKEVIGEFTTGDFAGDSGKNIRRVAQQVDGAIVKPGETFSLNGHTGPRGTAQGYVDAGIIQDGVPGRAVGGGISQFATTLYNASYFAGMKDAGHKEHSYYISRYPMGREATVVEGALDMAFTNDDPKHGVAIQTNWTPSSITVKIWGTKRYDVESKTGPKKNVKEAGTKTLDTDDCEPSGGIDGFTATDTRIIRDAKTGSEVRRESRTVTYNPKPEIKCKKDD
jgi:vancomycin resistance protein YoaR